MGRFARSVSVVALIALYVFGAAVFDKTTSASADTESTYYSNLEAFQTTNASSGANCQEMLRTANMIASTPQLRRPANVPRYFGTLALDAGMCLDDVRAETRDSLPARIPKSFLVIACSKVHPYLSSTALKEVFYNSAIGQITQACASDGRG